MSRFRAKQTKPVFSVATVIYHVSRIFPLLRLLVLWLVVVFSVLFTYLFYNEQLGHAKEELNTQRVDIVIPKSQISIAGQPLTKDQWIQLSVFAPNSDGTDLNAKASTTARYVSENETYVILSVSQDQAASLEKALLTENAKLIYHTLVAEPTVVTEKSVQVTAIPTSKPLAVFYVSTQPVATYEPQAPIDVCATVKGFMSADENGMISKDVSTPAFVLVEISMRHTPKIARALTNAASIFMLPVQDCN
jgi:hypothetical protein